MTGTCVRVCVLEERRCWPVFLKYSKAIYLAPFKDKIVLQQDLFFCRELRPLEEVEAPRPCDCEGVASRFLAYCWVLSVLTP